MNAVLRVPLTRLCAWLDSRPLPEEGSTLTGNELVAAADTLPRGEVAVLTDERPHSRAGWWLVSVGLVGFLLWAAVAPLDKGVPVPGTVTVSGSRKTVQHAGGGIVDQILVRDGDAVVAGQVLIRMNDTQARAEAESLRVQYWTALATEARLIAERDGAERISYPAVLLEAYEEPHAAAAMSSQQQLFASRRAVVRSELAILRELVIGYEAQLEGLTAARASKEAQRAVLAEQLTGLRNLAAEGYLPRNRLLEQERLYAQVDGAVSEDIGRIGQAQSQLLDARLRLSGRHQEDQSQIGSELSDAQVRAEALGHTLRAAQFTLDHAEVRAPVAGTVMGLTVFTSGGSVSPGKPLMDIVPENERLEIEGQVPVHLIDQVHSGLPVELLFTAFNQNRTPRIPATVASVSADRFVDERTGTPYYRLLALVTDEGIERLKGLNLRPGMPVEAFVKTGERSLLSYLFKPLADRAHIALSEE